MPFRTVALQTVRPCYKLGEKDPGSGSARLVYDPDNDTIEVTEKMIRYYEKKCVWVNVRMPPQVYTWKRAAP